MAELNLAGAVSEPLAAAFAYMHGQEPANKNILVYDLGGLSFDVSILKSVVTADQYGNDSKSVYIAAIGGNGMLGKDWDDRLFHHILRACCDECGCSEDEIDYETRQDIRIKVERAKKKLSTYDSVKVTLGVNGTRVRIEVTREEFENLTSDLVEQTMRYVEEILKEVDHIDEVFLVGGATYMPMICNAVEKRFPGKVQIKNPDCAIALGAPLYGQTMNDQPDPPIPPHKRSLYSPKIIATMIRYLIDHDDVAKELISEVDWEKLSPEELFDFFVRIRHLLEE